MTFATDVYGLDQEVLHLAQELVHVGTWTWDVATDTVEWSDEEFRLFGLEPQSMELSLRTYLGFVHPADRDRVARTIEASLASRSPYQFDARVIRHDGTIAHHHSRGTVICDESGDVVRMIGVATDITDQVRQQDALRESERRFRSIFEQSAVGMALAGGDGVFTSVNSAYAQFLGYAPEELIGRTFCEVTYPDDVERMWEVLATQVLDAPLSYEKRYLRKNGSIAWGRVTLSRLRNEDGALDGYFGIVEDITDHRAATEALREQTELLEGIMDNLPVMVSMFDPKGKPIYLNREWQRTFGWTLDEAQSIDLFDAIYPDRVDAQHAMEAMQAASLVWTDFEPRARDGRRVPSSWACTTLSDGRSLTIGQDTSERLELQQRLVQAQKMEALGQLAGGVAHDFNNLLTVISASAMFVREAITGNASAAADLNEITHATNRAAGLTRQLLAFSRRQMLKPELVDVNVSIEAMEKTLGRLMGEHIQLAIEPKALNATVEVDPHQLEQIILNLAVNARDAIEDDGTIVVETHNRLVTADGGERREYLVVSVADSGCGIAPEVRDRIFEPFFTTKGVGKGTGLGLATVHGIVAQSGGRIEVTSDLGRGTTFDVLLPVAEGVARSAIDAPDEETFGGPETVLLVEDESAVRAVAARVLRGLGYTVLEARHGGDAARISADHDGPIHLLITDVVMPKMGGRELARVVRTQRPDTRVLYVSGYTDDELLRKGILEPGAELLRKPFLPSELARSARELLRGAANRR